jgi:squalene-associated FAD-dependent desaturase
VAENKSVAVIGGGLAGLATAIALGSAGYEVMVYEARPFLGGRATSYAVNDVTIDNCQHILLRCCTNLMDFYKRLNVAEQIHFYKEFYWIEPGGWMSVMKRGMLPAPLHFTESFATLRFLSMADKLSVARGMLAAKAEFGKRADLDTITMAEWLREKKQTLRAIERFWRQVLVSAINEELDRMAAAHGLQVMALGFLADSRNYEMGVPRVPLGDLYSTEAWKQYGNVKFAFKAPVERLEIVDGHVRGPMKADAYVLAVPFERVCALAPELQLDLAAFTHSPITGIHLWFDRKITDLPHATLLDRTIQWMYNKEGGRHLQLVVSASRSLTEMPRGEVIERALKELVEFFPNVAQAKLEKAHVVKEVRATYSAVPGLEKERPRQKTNVSNLFLAGDWTKTGWPATMEGAVRSGYLAAESVSGKKFLLT